MVVPHNPSVEGADPERREADPRPRDTVRALLDCVRRRWRARVWLAAGSRAAFGAALVVAAVVLVARLGRPVGLPLVVLIAAGATVAAAVAIAFLWTTQWHPTDIQVARFIEEHHPELEDRLASASAQPEGSAHGSAFGDLVLTDAAERAREIDAGAIVQGAALRRAGVTMAGAAACLLVALLVARDPAGRALQVVWLHLFPETFSIEVEPGDARIVAGDPLTIRAEFHGGLGLSGGALPHLVVDDGGETRSVAMVPDGGAFAFEIPKVTKDFTYRVTVARRRSPDYLVSALSPPKVERIDVRYTYPEFTGLAPRLEEDGGDVYAPAGTGVQMAVHVDRPVESATLVMAGGARLDLEATAGRVLRGSLEVTRDGSYRVSLVDADGLINADSTEYFIRVMDDRPPEVRIMRPAGDREITALEEVTIEARADDDYGVDRFELVYAVRGGAERVLPLGRGGGATTVSGRQVLYVEGLGVESGDFITYYARARDVSRAKRSTESRSDIFFLDVKPFEEEFVAAQSQSMMGGAGEAGSLGELIGAQKAVIVATWKLERRSTGGRSADDIRAVGRAQGELKERTAEAAAEAAGLGGRARRGREFPAEAADASPLQRAVVAMAQAQTSLGELKTAEALPGEMEALNQLLKAQAAIRRRQVARQRAGGGGGSSAAQQDLSALFDRELQRQQETNYETPQRGRQAEQEPESEALRAVRELARRQDELSRQQRELARQRASLTSEEVKRRLERLTREQSDLRQQAEELARQLARQRSSQDGQASAQEAGRQTAQQGNRPRGGPPTGGGTAPGGRSMRRVSEQMQYATSELRRDDPGEASRRSDQALAGLRGIERELLGGQPARQRRALGELQLESQQVAEAQRGIAHDARQLASESPNAASARRLAGERERLADRVDDLERRLDELGRNMSAEQGKALGEAASTLRRERVGDRMRASAASQRQLDGATAEMTQGTGRPDETAERAAQATGDREVKRLARNDEELSRTLEGVARRLGDSVGGQDAEARGLSEQLAQSNALRDRLRGLQEQLDRLNAGRSAAGTPPSPPGPDGSSRQADHSGGQETASGADGAGGGAAAAEQAYREQLRKTLELMEALQQQSPLQGGGRGSPEGQQRSLSAPGTEAFKQDYAAWDVLRRDATLALEELEESLSHRLAERETEDRLHAGFDQRLPDDYRSLVAEYYQALAAKKRN